MIKQGFLKAATTLALAVSLATAQAQNQEKFVDPPIMLKAPEILPKDLLSNRNIKISDSVENDGFINSYRIKTSYGDSTLHGTAQLKERILEIQALYKLEELKNSKAFKESAKEGLKGPLKTVPSESEGYHYQQR